MYRLCSLLACASAFAAPPLLAQVAEPPATAAAMITSSDLTSHISVIADDSMLGRNTPSRELEMTAQYVADQFEKIGLKPGGFELKEGGGSGTWFIRYAPLTKWESARVIFSAGGKKARASTGQGFRLAGTAVPQYPSRGGVVLLAGRHTAQTLAPASVRDKIVLYVPPAGLDSAGQQRVIDQLVTANVSRGVVVLSWENAEVFQARARVTSDEPVPLPRADRPLTWAAYVRPEEVQALGGAFASLEEVLAAAGLELPRVRADSTPLIRGMPALEVEFSVQLDLLGSRLPPDSPTAPNVVAILEGSDSVLKHEYVIVSAHMDHIGITHGRADSINNGAHDNASGVAGLITLAKAFSHPAARPRRSLIFIATSGAAKGLWGSNAIVQVQRALASVVGHLSPASAAALKEKLWGVVFAINLDMIGRDAGDSITVNGLRDMKSAVSLDWVASGHPELGLTVVDGGSAISPVSDYFTFMQLGVPGLYFHNGSHEDVRQRDDTPAAVDSEQAARILRLVFYMGREIANVEQRPQWSETGRQRFLTTMNKP
jgi:hypothetical protein